jgi:hypothetical protein
MNTMKTEMTTTMGAGADNLQEYLQSLCDICVRDLHKHTEEIGRESYRYVYVNFACTITVTTTSYCH